MYILHVKLQPCWAVENLTVAGGSKQSSSLCVIEVIVNGNAQDQMVPDGSV